MNYFLFSRSNYILFFYWGNDLLYFKTSINVVKFIITKIYFEVDQKYFWPFKNDSHLAFWLINYYLRSRHSWTSAVWKHFCQILGSSLKDIWQQILNGNCPRCWEKVPPDNARVRTPPAGLGYWVLNWLGKVYFDFKNN